MINLNSEVFYKNKKRNTLYLMIGIILLIITVLLIYLGIKNEKQELPEPVALINLRNGENIEEDKYVFIDVNTKPYLFAVYETDGIEDNAKYYFVMDKNNYLYIVYMTDAKAKTFETETIKDNSIIIYGITKKIPNDIKDLAIESYNDLMEDTYLTKENFKEYVGFMYLDSKTPLYDSSLYYMGAFLTGFFFILIIVVYIVIIIKNKKTLKKISNEELANIDVELSQTSNNKYKKLNLYLLKNCIVDFGNNIIIKKYSDIIWAYPYEQRYNGLIINRFIKLVDKDNKMYNIAISKIYEKNKEILIQEILNELKLKNENIILGYDKYNKKIVKEKIKEIKNK